jgi:hypothetical protein
MVRLADDHSVIGRKLSSILAFVAHGARGHIFTVEYLPIHIVYDFELLPCRNIEKQNVVRNDAVMATDEISFFWGWGDRGTYWLIQRSLTSYHEAFILVEMASDCRGFLCLAGSVLIGLLIDLPSASEWRGCRRRAFQPILYE